MIQKISAFILILLGIYMIFLGLKSSMQPPLITGIGFILIGILNLLGQKNKDLDKD